MPQLNGISKRRNRILLDMVQSMMNFTDLPVFLWDHALFSAIHFLNQIFYKFISTTPYDLWYGKKPTLKYLKIWGCPAHIKWQQTDKLEARSFRTCFIGYPKKIIGYYFYLSEDHNVIVSHHAIIRGLSSKRRSLKSIESKNLNPVVSQYMWYLLHLVDQVGSPILLKGT